MGRRKNKGISNIDCIAKSRQIINTFQDNMTVETKDEMQVSVTAIMPTQIEIEKLGRERPGAFASAWGEFGFCFSILISVFMAVRLEPCPQTPCRSIVNPIHAHLTLINRTTLSVASIPSSLQFLLC